MQPEADLNECILSCFHHLVFIFLTVLLKQKLLYAVGLLWNLIFFSLRSVYLFLGGGCLCGGSPVPLMRGWLDLDWNLAKSKWNMSQNYTSEFQMHCAALPEVPVVTHNLIVYVQYLWTGWRIQGKIGLKFGFNNIFLGCLPLKVMHWSIFNDQTWISGFTYVSVLMTRLMNLPSRFYDLHAK